MDNQPQLTPDDEAFIDEALKFGRYASRAEIFRVGLSSVREREAQWARFDAEIQKGIDDWTREGSFLWRKLSKASAGTSLRKGRRPAGRHEGRPGPQRTPYGNR